MKRLFFFPIILLLCSPISGYSQEKTSKLPAGFVYISDVIPDVLLDIRYYSKFNFVGSRVDGYLAPVAILTQEATLALVKAADELRAQGYILKIFDGYRPQKAVEHFVRWANDVNDTIYKRTFYPNVDKSRLFELMYIAARSGHSRGSTIDLTLVDMSTGKELDMGAPFDFFGPVSGHDTNLITEEQKTNRELLKNTMTKYGFKINNEEWWHYAFVGEPYPSTYFDFDVAM
ncbi:MAG: M15 family metallopeptidase [Prevotellaceae bacterium]|jgi:D-alanyl-D-alanine dipeptidase|nr:M15 family metallopeptidase [Prevotellaceae bacterium]